MTPTTGSFNPDGVALRLITALLTMSSLAGCDPAQPVAPDPPPSPIMLTIVNGSETQEAVTGDLLPTTLAVRLTRDGAPVVGEPVTWSSESGRIAWQTSWTDVTGVARARWQLGVEPGEWRAVASLTNQPDLRAEFRARAWERVIPTLVGSTQSQGVVVTGSVSLLIHVRSALTGAAVAGVPVTWSSAAALAPSISMTNASGIAETRLTTGTKAGGYAARATVRGAPGVSLSYEVTAHPGPAALVRFSNAPQSLAVNWRDPTPVYVEVTDLHGNRAGGARLSWSSIGDALHLTGPESLGPTETTARGAVVPTGVLGPVELQVGVLGGAAPATHLVVVGPPEYRVVLDPSAGGFRSLQNGSFPAVDTIPVGALVTWRLQPFDYEIHGVAIAPMTGVTGGGEFPYGNPSVVTARFDVVGVYEYWVPETYWEGTIVVVP